MTIITFDTACKMNVGRLRAKFSDTFQTLNRFVFMLSGGATMKEKGEVKLLIGESTESVKDA